MAAMLAEALVNQVNHWEDVHAAETLEEAYSRCDGVVMVLESWKESHRL